MTIPVARPGGSGIRPGRGGDFEEGEAGAASFLGGFDRHEFHILKNSGRLVRVSAGSEKSIDRKEEIFIFNSI